MSENGEWVSVMVPRGLVTKVYGFIAQLDAGRGAAPSVGGPSSADASKERSDDDEWTASRLRKMVEESPPAMRDILGLLSSRPGQWVGARELTQAIRGDGTASSSTFAGTLGAFGRRIKNRYDIAVWPFEDRYSHEAGGREYRMSLSMAQRVADALAKHK